MKKLKYFLVITVLLVTFLFSPVMTKANWIKKETKTALINNQTGQSSVASKKDSLPEGVTDDWLNSLRDENGEKVIPESNRTGRIPEDPEGDAMQRKIFNGLGAGDNFGYSVSSAGDVNGDGYSDVIIGAYTYSSNTGRAYIFFGGLNMNTVADVTMTGEAANDLFGISVSGAGDVNGDGYSDVIVGAYAFISYTGKAYIYFGGSSINNVADVTMTGEAADNAFAYSVSSAGDVNGDGYSDVIVGAYAFSSHTGRAYIYFGGSSINNVADVTMTGEAESNQYGYSVSSAGDVNGDGYSDVIVGAYNYYGATGRVYIYFGGASMNDTADLTMTGETESFFGYSVSLAGDVNGDGYSDVIIGAYTYSTNTGRAYIYFGGASMNNTADVTMTGETTYNYIGTSVSSAGDVNGDGYSDVIVGATYYSSSTGRAYIYFGGASMNNIADVTITGETTGDRFGVSVSSAGDVNGDGYSDVIVGAFGYSGNTGRIYLYDYFMKNEIVHDLAMTGEATNNNFGVSVSSAGDVNGDGYSDVIVGAYGYSSNTGRAYIYFGGASMNDTADVTMTGETTNNYFGISVSSAGDVNGDGYSDVIIGAFGYSSNTGRAYIFYGGLIMNTVADVTMTGETIGDIFGRSVSSAGDVNGDGYSDVIVCARGYSINTGRAYIYFGGASMNDITDVTMTGETTNNSFGYSVSSAGDVNGDGYSDVIVGATYYSSSTGRAYIFYGGLNMNTVADVTMTGEAANDLFGISVSGAGDVNGDGYSDVIVGVYGYSTNTGRAYMFFGGASMNNTSDVTMTGETTNNYFGHTVSSAGDVNGDGYSDVIVSAIYFSSSTGRAYIYFGGASMNNTAEVTMTGETTNNFFGCSVSSAGDVNGDGYSDVIVGAQGYSSYTGKAYMYLGSAISAKPILVYVKDVPNDQGGFVDLKWARSSYDVIGTNMITDYVVQRSAPPVGGNFAWVNLAYIPATKEPFYSYISNMPYDSSANSNGSFFFRITARTSDVNQFWRSAILSGRSIDNVAPPMVSSFTVTPLINSVRLDWSRNTAPDFLNYILSRSASQTIDLDTVIVLATTTDTTFLDTDPPGGVYFYFLVAQDIHGNYSPVAVTQSPSITLNLSMFIEGFYNAGSNSQVSDTITAELRNTTSPFAVADQAIAVVSSEGTVQLKFSNAPDGNYYIAIKHRNSIETWSANTLAFSQITPVSYNFSIASSQAFGSNLIQVDSSPIRFAIYSGDVNQDGVIDASDNGAIDNDAANFSTGYLSTDLNGDEVIDASDAAIADNNSANFVAAITP